ncbi:S1C family serine protease [Methylorubrum salsuginis]|uniref:Trypsin-like peptidase domain-containing protein n=1 Tax=Methylorubrum salsuginis TaxID=414703 RepID=A0A1I4CYF0_9HYPH|nr:serine protease [Methylorubrum salsuginis]SFK85803.1 Trypsin-like peptidase domain-containing protein [Methylorubrum salsuginis]
MRSAIAAALGLLVAGAAQAGPVLSVDKSIEKVAGWSIGVSKALNGCLAAATYQDETTVWMGFDGDKDEAFLAFTNPRWKSIEPDRVYHLAMMTGRGRWKGRFTGVERTNERGLYASGLKKGFVLDIARAGGVDVIFEQKSIARLSLSGSSDAISAMIDCQKAVVEAKSTAGKEGGKAEAAPKKDGVTSGTGFFVSDAGHVLTNHHVIGNCTEISVAKFGVPSVRARLVATDAQNDLAVLSTGIEKPVVPAMSLRPRIGESVYAYGFPLPSLLAASGNFTVGNITASAGLGDDTRMLQISTPVQPGNSGGPLVDQYGAVVGVIQSKLNALNVALAGKGDIPQNVNFAIKTMIALNFLDANGIPTTVGIKSPTPLDAASVAEQAKLFTVHVTCR